jgi:CheY-like chemotaxis protein
MRRLRVLVVDDNPDMRASLRRLLEQAGYEAREACDGNQAIKLHRELQAQVLVTDIFMPVKDGIETIEAFKREWPLVRVIAMSGGGRRAKRDYLQVADVVGADAVLQKPFSLSSLIDAIER